MPRGIHIHKLENVDLENLLADCAQCGVAISIKLKSGKPRCRGSIRDAKNKSTGVSTVAKHGLTREHAQEARNDSECAICGSTERLMVDHDHTTGELRGILCGNCNTGLGMFEDSINRMMYAIIYLDNPPGVTWQR